MPRLTLKVLKWAAATAGILFIAAQLIPYGRAHQNPRVVVEPPWADGATRALAVRACFDCHSNETTWPWYSSVAPTSWLVQRHVDEGRQVLNFSEWNRPHEAAPESSEAVREGEMPPPSYLVAHPSARLTAAEKDALARGMGAMTSESRGPRPRDGNGRTHDDD